MSLLRNMVTGLRSLFHREQVNRELAEELGAYLEMVAEEKRKQGTTGEEALRAVRLERGSLELAKEVVWSARWESFVETCLQDLHYGARILRKSPGFAAVAVLTLALGIGANTAIFSVVYTVLLKALPYPQADRLVMVYENLPLPNYQNNRNTPSPGNFSDWSAQNTVFENMAAYSNRSFNVTGTGEPVRIEGELVSAAFFPTLRVNAALGRVFIPEEDRPGSSHVAVMSDGLWRDRKSTRLNSSHVSISYAVFCLKKKKYLRWYYDSNVWKRLNYRGVRILKNVSDLWNYQEIIHERRIEWVIETGTRPGGSAVCFA